MASRSETTIQGHRLVFRTWNWGMKQDALRKATTWVRDAEGLQPDVDPWILNDMMLQQTIIDWDLKDNDGEPLPITLESIRSLEPGIVEEMIAFTQRLNGVSFEERKKS